MAAKEMCFQKSIVKSQYQTVTNPIFEVFYLGDAHGVIADFSGNAPYEFATASILNLLSKLYFLNDSTVCKA